MEVVGHQTIAQEVDRYASARVDHCLDEGVVIPGFVEDGLAAVAPVQGVIPHPADRGASSPRHLAMMPARSPVFDKALRPPFLAFFPVDFQSLLKISGTRLHMSAIIREAYAAP
jgi:hypothetical protein